MAVEADTGCRQNLGFLAPHIIPLPEPSPTRRSRVTGSKEGDFEAEWGPSDNGNDKLGIWLREISLLVREMQSPIFCRLAELSTGVLCPKFRLGYQMVLDPYTDGITAVGLIPFLVGIVPASQGLSYRWAAAQVRSRIRWMGCNTITGANGKRMRETVRQTGGSPRRLPSFNIRGERLNTPQTPVEVRQSHRRWYQGTASSTLVFTVTPGTRCWFYRCCIPTSPRRRILGQMDHLSTNTPMCPLTYSLLAYCLLETSS